MKITIKVKGGDFELSIGEARELYNELGKTLDMVADSGPYKTPAAEPWWGVPVVTCTPTGDGIVTAKEATQ